MLTTQARLPEIAFEADLPLDRLDPASSALLLPAEIRKDELTDLLEIGDGHPLTLRILAALVRHLGAVRFVVERVGRRPELPVELPGRAAHDAGSSLDRCLSVPLERRSPPRRGTAAEPAAVCSVRLGGSTRRIADLRTSTPSFSFCATPSGTGLLPCPAFSSARLPLPGLFAPWALPSTSRICCVNEPTAGTRRDVSGGRRSPIWTGRTRNSGLPRRSTRPDGARDRSGRILRRSQLPDDFAC